MISFCQFVSAGVFKPGRDLVPELSLFRAAFCRRAQDGRSVAPKGHRGNRVPPPAPWLVRFYSSFSFFSFAHRFRAPVNRFVGSNVSGFVLIYVDRGT